MASPVTSSCVQRHTGAFIALGEACTLLELARPPSLCSPHPAHTFPSSGLERKRAREDQAVTQKTAGSGHGSPQAASSCLPAHQVLVVLLLRPTESPPSLLTPPSLLRGRPSLALCLGEKEPLQQCSQQWGPGQGRWYGFGRGSWTLLKCSLLWAAIMWSCGCHRVTWL